jgi:hypothetical protein
MVLENLLEIITEINRSEISISNKKRAQTLSLIELEYYPDDRMQFNGFNSLTEYQQHLMNAHRRERESNPRRFCILPLS